MGLLGNRRGRIHGRATRLSQSIARSDFAQLVVHSEMGLRMFRGVLKGGAIVCGTLLAILVVIAFIATIMVIFWNAHW